MTPARSGLAFAASAVVAALVVILPVPAPVRLAAAWWLLGVLPGLVLVRALPDGGSGSAEDLALGALTASLPLGMLLATAGMWHPLDPAWLAALLALVLAVAALLRPGPVARRPAPDRGAWIVCLATGVVCAAPLTLNPTVRVYGDALFHGSIVNEILVHGLPPQDPAFAGMPLAYAWPLHAWVAALAHLAGTTPYQVYPLVAFAGGLTIALVFLSAARSSGASAGTARISVIVMLFAMNALGAAQGTLRYALSPFLGHDRGGPGFKEWLALCFDRPDAGAVAGALVFHGHYVLSSFLYKFVCVNAVSVSLVLAAAAAAAAFTALRTGGARPVVLAGLCTAGAALAHPVVGISSAVALGFGLTLALASPVQRVRGLVTLLTVAWGGLLALPPLLRMLAAPLAGGVHTEVLPFTGNLFALPQALVVSAPLSVFAFRRAWRDDPRFVAVAAGYACIAIAISLTVRFPSDAYAYPVYLAYLGTAWLLPHAVAGVREAAAHRPLVRQVSVAALVLLPLTTLLLVQGFARHDARWGLAGYPETADERAVFDRLRTTPADAVVLDTQNFQMSAAAGYSARRTLFGGSLQVALVGYPAAEMRRREQAIRDVLFAPTTADSSWGVLDRLGPAVFVVARRTPSGGRVFDQFEQPAGDPIAKLDSLPARLEPVLHTPTIALYRYRTRPAR